MLPTRPGSNELQLLLGGLDQQSLSDFHQIPIQVVPFLDLIRSDVELPGDAEECVPSFDRIVEGLAYERSDGCAQSFLLGRRRSLSSVNSIYVVDERVQRRFLTPHCRKVTARGARMGDAHSVRGQKVETSLRHGQQCVVRKFL